MAYKKKNKKQKNLLRKMMMNVPVEDEVMEVLLLIKISLFIFRNWKITWLI